MRILLIARTLHSASCILLELCQENSEQVSQLSPRILWLKDGTIIYAATPVTLERDLHTYYSDQIIVESGVNREFVAYAVNQIAPRSRVPEEFLVQILDE